MHCINTNVAYELYTVSSGVVSGVFCIAFAQLHVCDYSGCCG